MNHLLQICGPNSRNSGFSHTVTPGFNGVGLMVNLNLGIRLGYTADFAKLWECMHPRSLGV